MSYIETKYRNKIYEIFDELSDLDNKLLEQLNKKYVKYPNKIAKLCSNFTRNINIIQKKYYPEIKQMGDKLDIKSSLRFYFTLIEKLTELIRNSENFKDIDDEYYEMLIEFINEKDNLITGQFKTICSQELSAFYNQNSRQNLEKILKLRIKQGKREYFAPSSLEKEIKKIARGAGADLVGIYPADILKSAQFSGGSILFESAQTIIMFVVGLVDDIIIHDFSDYDHEEFNPYNDIKTENLQKIGREIINFLVSKNYKAIQLTEKENKTLNLLKKNSLLTYEKLKLSYTSSVITDAKLTPDKRA